MNPSTASLGYPFAREWRPRALAFWTLAALVLMGSWLFPPTRAAWDLLDVWFYYAINATVAWGKPVAAYWAVTGDRRFDFLAAIIVFSIYVHFISRDDDERLSHGLALGAMTAVLLAVMVGIWRELLALPRLAPANVLESHHSIAAQIPWSRAKEVSPRSFPGDHALVMMIITAMWWRGDGRRLGLLAVTLSILFVTPRMAAGAHWLTDALVGGGFAVLLTLALVEGTPLCWRLYGALRVCSDLALDFWNRGVDMLSPPGAVRMPPKRQILRGMCIGAADLVPGVSGGTMALILGVYRRLIAAISHVDAGLFALIARGRIMEALRRVDVLFILPLAAGILFALVIFSRIIPLSVLLAELPEMMFGLFFGLIAASIVHLLKSLHPRGAISYGWIALGMVFGLAIVNIVPVDTPGEMWFLFLCGMMVIVAMLIPGVSGSFVLLLLGKYTDAIDALGRLDFTFLMPLAAGAVVGAIAFSRAISWLLDRFYRPTMLTVIGILGGSILAVWPFQDRDYQLIGDKLRLVSSHPYVPGSIDIGVFLGLAAMIAGALIFRWLTKLAAGAEIKSREGASSPSNADVHPGSR